MHYRVLLELMAFALINSYYLVHSFRPVEVDGVNDIAAILCSSGTTGPFKGTFYSSN